LLVNPIVEGGKAGVVKPNRSVSITTETDPWLQCTGWEKVLARSIHGLVKMAEFAEPELEQILQSWERIFQRSLTRVFNKPL
jgi:hypothetical protein